MTHKEFEDKCWSYYIFLENSFLHTTRYVYLSKDNFKAYSYEFDRLLLTVATELENAIKIIYGTITGNQIQTNKPHSICVYYTDIKDTLFSTLTSGNFPEVRVVGRDITLSPFSQFCSTSSWWSDYNSVKHDRLSNQHLANMENVLNALASVFCLDSLFAMHLVPNPVDQDGQMDVLLPQSNLFYCSNFSFIACAGPIITISSSPTCR